MTLPTSAPVPDPNNTGPAEDENPPEGGHDTTHFTEEQQGTEDPETVSPTQDASKDEEKGALRDTDTEGL